MAIVVLAFLVYVPSLAGGAVWDDRAIMTGWGIGGGKSLLGCFVNPFLLHYYRPLTSASYYMDVKLFGPNPLLLHQTNILLHCLATTILIWLTIALFNNRRIALLAGLFFAIMPNEVGTIAWIGGRCDQLGAVLMLGMALCLVNFHKAGKVAWLISSLVCFFAAMMVKEQFALLGILVPVTAFALQPADRRLRSALVTTAPFFAVGVVFMMLWVANFPEPYPPAFLGIGEQVSRLGRSTLNYTLLLFLPNPWSMNTFSLQSLRNPICIGLGLGLFVASFFALRALWRYDRRFGWLAVGIMVGFLPVSNLVPMPSLLVAPYRLGAIGPLVAMLVAAGCYELYRRRNFVPVAILGFGAMSGLILTPWGASKWMNEKQMFGTFVSYDPGSIGLRSCFATALEASNDKVGALVQSKEILDEALGKGRWENYEQIKNLTKTDPSIHRSLLMSDGWNRDTNEEISMFLALHAHLLRGQNREAEAERALQASVSLDQTNAKGWLELGQLARSRNEDPIRYLSNAMACNPKDSVVASLLARSYIDKGEKDLAYRVLERVPAMNPEMGESLLDLAQMQIERRELAKAAKTLDQAATTVVDITRMAKLRDETRQVVTKA